MSQRAAQARCVRFYRLNPDLAFQLKQFFFQTGAFFQFFEHRIACSCPAHAARDKFFKALLEMLGHFFNDCGFSGRFQVQA